jgi:hypothetical protein
MVPDAFTNFFIASAGASAALLGLLFVSISISPEEKITATASVEKRISAYSALVSLTNAFIISLMALVPGNYGIYVLIFSASSIIITIQNNIEQLRPHKGASSLGRRLFLALLSLLAYLAEAYLGVRLIITPHDAAPVNTLAIVLLVVYISSIIRAWELLGGASRTTIPLLTTHPTQHTSSSNADENATPDPD